jgi:KaiC/GvpD/RAD55 family RecA-like ATPase
MFEYYQSMFEKLMPTLSLQDRKFLEKKLEPPRRKLVRWFHEMKNMGTTAILTAEKSLGVRATRLSFAEYLSDCFILLHYSHCGHERRRAIEILKLRGRPHSKWIHPLDITPKGIEIRSEQYIPRYQVK